MGEDVNNPFLRHERYIRSICLTTVRFLRIVSVIVRPLSTIIDSIKIDLLIEEFVDENRFPPNPPGKRVKLVFNDGAMARFESWVTSRS